MKIDIDDRLHALLGKLVRPFIDHTPADVIVRLVEDEFTRVRQQNSPSSDNILNIDGHQAPPLTFVRTLRIFINGREQNFQGWNPLLYHVIDGLDPRSTPFEQIISVNFLREKPIQNQSYTHCPNADVWVQNQDAIRAWKAIVAVADYRRLDLIVECEWGRKSPQPGQRARLVINHGEQSEAA